VAYQSSPRVGLPELDALGQFVAVVDAGGFTAAARQLGLRKATLSRGVAQLEQRLGARLLHRTTRTIRLTDSGLTYYEHATRALSAARDAEAALARRAEEPEGLVRVAAIPLIAELLVEPVVVPLLARYPRMRIEFVTGARVVDLAGEGFDLALRAGAPPLANQRVRVLGVAGIGYFAAPAYLARRGSPTHPADLDRHDILVLSDAVTPAWTFIVNGRPIKRQVRPRLVGSGEVVLRAAQAGGGIVRMPAGTAAPLVSSGTLVPVLAAWTPSPLPVMLVMPEGRPSRVARLFIDLATRALSGHPALST
jgi:DNA-binding transcriptional LysR family regulator